MKKLLVFFAILGVLASVGAVIYGNQPPAAVSPPIAFPCAPFPAWVAGLGTLEPSTQNIAVGSSISGIVSEVSVSWGQVVQKGEHRLMVPRRPQTNT